MTPFLVTLTFQSNHLGGRTDFGAGPHFSPVQGWSQVWGQSWEESGVRGVEKSTVIPSPSGDRMHATQSTRVSSYAGGVLPQRGEEL